MLRHTLLALLLVSSFSGLGLACGGKSKKADDTTPVASTTDKKEEPATPPADDPARKLTEDECNAALDHAIALLEANEQTKQFADQIRQGREEAAAECLKTGTKKDYDCLMAAQTAQDLGNCEEPAAAE